MTLYALPQGTGRIYVSTDHIVSAKFTPSYTVPSGPNDPRAKIEELSFDGERWYDNDGERVRSRDARMVITLTSIEPGDGMPVSSTVTLTGATAEMMDTYLANETLYPVEDTAYEVSA